MHERGDAARRFILLCARDRQPLYAALLDGLAPPHVLVEDMPQLLGRCAEASPLAVLVDTVSASRLGAAAVNPLFEVGTSWPVLRCTPRPDGQVAVLCMAPYRQGLLAEALGSIAAGDADWQTPWPREYLRVPVQARARLRRSDTPPWHDANLLDISPQGAFVVSYEPFERGNAVELDIHDICAEPVHVRAQVAWCRRWADGPGLPGVGVAFDAATVPEALRREITTTLAPKAALRPASRRGDRHVDPPARGG